MVSCSQFLRDFSDYRDGVMDPSASSLVEEHLAACSGCASYARVVERGVAELQASPVVEPSEDFLSRLQYRLYALEDHRALAGNGSTSATSAGFVVLMVMLIGAAAWLPVLRPRAATVQLPPALAVAPDAERSVHALFRSGPLLLGPVENGLLADTNTPTLFSRYTPVRAAGMRTAAARPR
jgi:anti-sigma factor RsiW